MKPFTVSPTGIGADAWDRLLMLQGRSNRGLTMKITLGFLLLMGIQASAIAGECADSVMDAHSADLLPARLMQVSPVSGHTLAWAGDPSPQTREYLRRDYFPNPGEGADLRDPHANWLDTGDDVDITAFPPSKQLLDKLISRRELHRQHIRARQAGMRTLLFGLLAMGLGARR